MVGNIKNFALDLTLGWITLFMGDMGEGALLKLKT
jgi:hypothetical protein